ncbi:alpha/beta-hydrolase [Pyrenochaeta sp. DS3sAY3a]|nr:alpha/beta-hydrolase [Pyrenochaeta sp. DS3sAY3a]
MKSSLVFGFAASVLVSGISCNPTTSSGFECQKPLPEGIEPGKSVNLTLKSASGVSIRKYRLHLPKPYNGNNSVPLILSFHGRTQDAKFQEKLSKFSNATYGFEGIAVYPEGVPSEKGVQQWQGDPDSPESINDVTFTLELLDHLESTYCIDKSRIYAAGKSNGGGFTGILACDAEATKRIAAFAPVSGAFYLNEDQELPACNPSRKPIPIMELHGWKDTTIPYLGGLNKRENANITNIATYVDKWATRNGFDVAGNETTYLCRGNRKVTRYSWDDVVVHYNYTNLYHDWPSSYANGDTEDALTCVEAEATSIILAWFKKWTI